MYNSSVSPTHPRYRASQKRSAKKIIIIALTLITVSLAFKFFHNSTRVGLLIPTANKGSNLSNQDLSQVVQNALSGTQGTYSVAIKNLSTDESYFYNDHHSYESGSLYKLWIMAETYQQIQSGQLTKDQTLSQDIPTLNEEFDIDPELAEQTDGTITASVSDALNQMITYSDNYSALLLTEKIKLSSVAQFLKGRYLESTVGTDGGYPTTTASDIEAFLEDLYRGKLANSQYTNEMINILKAQQLNNGLPKELPSNAVVAHKTGDIDDFKHDAGIVYTPKGNYIIVVMSESDFPAGAQDRIAQVSRAVYNYFESVK